MELQQIMKGIDLKTPDELGISFECDETGTSFQENSLLKAETLYKLTGTPVIADDSGLCIEALDGAPGIYSARYGSEDTGKELESPERNRFLLDNLKTFSGAEKRRAVFVCCMTAIIDDYRIYSIQETMKGIITEEPYGKGGFGYDPVFYLPEKKMTVAELPEAEKNRISHRGRAAIKLGRLLEGALDE